MRVAFCMGVKMEIREYLQQHRVLTDGAFGTYFAEKYNYQDLPELANYEHPDWVSNVHSAYIAAGSNLIRTNTFAMNTGTMDWEFEKVKEGILEAVTIAKDAAAHSGNQVFIAGDIGPLYRELYESAEQIKEEYYELANIFLEAGIEILTFETLPDLDHVLPAIRRIKKESNPFIMVQFSSNQFGYTTTGRSIKALLRDCEKIAEIDAVGLNCGIGPSHMLQLLQQCELPKEKYFIIMPNAGYPIRVREKIQFADNALYFVEKMQEILKYGGDIIGGCCGTNPTFIRKLAKTLTFSYEKKNVDVKKTSEEEITTKKTGFFYTTKGELKQKPLIAVELAPPMGAEADKLLEAVHILENLEVDVLTFPDSPSGRTRVDSVLMADRVQKETHLQVMPHICCRDKNAIAMRSLLLGAHVNEIDNLLIVTGDPIPMMERAVAKPVFNFNSVGLMEIVKELNEEQFQTRPMTFGGAINQGRRNLDAEIKKVLRKMEAGASFFFTQPVFTKEDAERVRLIKAETGARILCGIMPLVSRKNALFMMNEMPGIQVTDEIVERYPEQGTREEGEAVGIAIAKEMMDYTGEFVDGYYFSFPFNRVYLLEKILE